MARANSARSVRRKAGPFRLGGSHHWLGGRLHPAESCGGPISRKPQRAHGGFRGGRSNRLYGRHRGFRARGDCYLGCPRFAAGVSANHVERPATSVAAAYAITVRLPYESGPHAETVVAINVLFVGVFVILTLLLMLVLRFTGWQIEHEAAQGKERNGMESQFGIKDLLLAQVLLAAALGVGRWLWPPGMVTRQGAEEMAVALPITAAILAVRSFPVVSAFGIILARLCGERRLTAPLAVIWGSVNLVLVMLAVFVPTGTGCKEGAVIAVYLVALVPLQLGYLLVSLPNTAAAYYGGYRLVRRINRVTRELRSGPGRGVPPDPGQ